MKCDDLGGGGGGGYQGSGDGSHVAEVPDGISTLAKMLYYAAALTK